MSFDADAVVVGAGPAGCSAAIHLARAGRRVILLDKARFPRPKACGEGVMPEGMAALRELDLAEDIERAGRPYRGIRFTSLDGRQAAGRFAAGAHGIVVRRETLDHRLLERARNTPHLRVIESRRAVEPVLDEATVTAIQVEGDGALRAPFFLIADGANSQLARQLGARRSPARVRFGLRTHFEEVRGCEEFVEVCLLAGGELYLAPQPGGTALVSLLLEEAAMREFSSDGAERAFLEKIASSTFASRRLAGARRVSPILGAGPLGGSAQRVCGPNWLLVGDAAGSVDPITGEGISLALLGGRLAAEQLIRGDGPRGYRRRLFALCWRKRVLSSALLAICDRPRLSGAAIGSLSRWPAAFDFILSIC